MNQWNCGRSEAAKVASITAERPGSIGGRVCLDDGAHPFASHDGHHDRAWIGTIEDGVHLHAYPLRDPVDHAHRHRPLVLVDHPEPTERVRMEVRSMPRVESIGDDVPRVALRFQSHHGLEETSRPLRENRRGRRLLVGQGTNPEQDTVVVGLDRLPAAEALRPQLEPVPRTDDAPVLDEALGEARAHVRAVVRSHGDRSTRVPPHHVVLPGHAIVLGRVLDRSHAVDGVPSAGRQLERELERSFDPGGLSLLPVRLVGDRFGRPKSPANVQVRHVLLTRGSLFRRPRDGTQRTGSDRTPCAARTVLAAKKPDAVARSMSALGKGSLTKSPARVRPS